jgi:hypothetical protein
VFVDKYVFDDERFHPIRWLLFLFFLLSLEELSLSNVRVILLKEILMGSTNQNDGKKYQER